jgi:hypothetical protein
MVCLCYAYVNFRGTMLLCLIHYVLLQVFGLFNFRMKKNNKIKCLQLFCCFNCLLYQWCIKFVGICLFWGLLTFIHLTMLVVVGCSEAAIDSVFISGLKPHFFFLQLVILHSVWSNRIIVSILFYCFFSISSLVRITTSGTTFMTSPIWNFA